MVVEDLKDSSAHERSMEWKERYESLKRRLQILNYEQESFISELEKAQRKLLRVSRDKTFLLERLLQYEQVSDNSSNDSDATLSSDCDAEIPVKRKKLAINGKTEMNVTNGVAQTTTTLQLKPVTGESNSTADCASASVAGPVSQIPVKQETSDSSINVSDVERQLSSSNAENTPSIRPLDPFPTTDLPQDVFE